MNADNNYLLSSAANVLRKFKNHAIDNNLGTKVGARKKPHIIKMEKGSDNKNIIFGLPRTRYAKTKIRK